jgi:hypothetical protein
VQNSFKDAEKKVFGLEKTLVGKVETKATDIQIKN